MSDVEDRPEDADGPAPEQPAPDSAAWPSLPPVDGEGEANPEQTGAPAEPAAAPAVPEGTVASGPVAPDTPPGTDAVGTDVAPTDVPPASAVPESADRSEQPVAPVGWVAAPVAGEGGVGSEPVAPAGWAAPAGAAASPPVADDGGVPEPIAPAAALPRQAATGGPGAPEQPAAYGGWSAPPAVRVDERADAQGWPEPARQDGPGGLPSAPAAPARPTAADHPPHGQSRNPVDRLTRGLPHPLRVTIDWIVTIVGAVAIVLLVKAFVVNPYRIPSSSMETTLHCAQPAVGCQARFSDRVLANRFLYRLRDPRRGEIIVFETPPAARLKCGAGGTFVKRVIGLPGETVEVRLRNGDGYVYINGKPLREPYVDTTRRGAVQEFGPVRVKPENYFMMGDNRGQSCDSRMWGTVPRGNLIGKVFATYWPPNRVSLH